MMATEHTNQRFSPFKEKRLAIHHFCVDKVRRDKQSYLSWEDLDYLERNGATIGNHTHSHGHLVRLGPNETEGDWLAELNRK